MTAHGPLTHVVRPARRYHAHDLKRTGAGPSNAHGAVCQRGARAAGSLRELQTRKPNRLCVRRFAVRTLEGGRRSSLTTHQRTPVCSAWPLMLLRSLFSGVRAAIGSGLSAAASRAGTLALPATAATSAAAASSTAAAPTLRRGLATLCSSWSSLSSLAVTHCSAQLGSTASRTVLGSGSSGSMWSAAAAAGACGRSCAAPHQLLQQRTASSHLKVKFAGGKIKSYRCHSAACTRCCLYADTHAQYVVHFCTSTRVVVLPPADGHSARLIPGPLRMNAALEACSSCACQLHEAPGMVDSPRRPLHPLPTLQLLQVALPGHWNRQGAVCAARPCAQAVQQVKAAGGRAGGRPAQAEPRPRALLGP